jgi:hypothetical protein
MRCGEANKSRYDRVLFGASVRIASLAPCFGDT